MQANWIQPKQYSQISTGQVVRFKAMPSVNGRYRGKGLDEAIVRVESGIKGAPRDCLVKLKDIEVQA